MVVGARSPSLPPTPVYHSERAPKPNRAWSDVEMSISERLRERAANAARRSVAAARWTRQKEPVQVVHVPGPHSNGIVYVYARLIIGAAKASAVADGDSRRREYYTCAKVRALSRPACPRSRRARSRLLGQHARQGWLRGPSRTGNAPEPPSSPHNSRAAPGLIHWRSPRGATRGYVALVKTHAG